MRRTGAAFAALCVSLALAAPAAAQPAPPLGHAGRWITDAGGHVVILHGLNVVYKVAPYYPSVAGFSADDAQFLADNGFNTVRLGVIYKAVEPSPGVYDDNYLNQIAATQQMLADHGIYTLLDFHQDLYNEQFQGEGWPDWAVQTDMLPAQPQTGFPGNYVAMPALNRAFDHFWANDLGPGAVGLQDRYAAAWRHVAARFSSSQRTIGYDLLNEPWPGSVWPTCANPTPGCPAFDGGPLASFGRKSAVQIRAVEPQKLIWYEPNLIFDFGAMTQHPGLGDAQAGFTFHDYCLPASLGLPIPGGLSCPQLENLAFQNADAQSAKTGDALLLGEFGSTDDLATLQRIVDGADAHMVSWQEWAYCVCADPTATGGGTQALVIDPNQPPAGANVKQDKLAVLSRPYPQVVAGTPQGYSFDPATNRFQLSYSTARANGQGSFQSAASGPGLVTAGSPQTEVFIPPLHYPGGYAVQVHGAAIASAPGASTLRLIACPGAGSVSVTVLPAASGPAIGPDCRIATEATKRSCKKRSNKRLRQKLKRAQRHHKHKRAKKLRHRLRKRRCRR